MHSRHSNLGFARARHVGFRVSIEEIMTDYPHLTREDILATIAYGAEMSRERFVDLPVSSAA